MEEVKGHCWEPCWVILFPFRFSSEEVCTCPQASVPQQFASVPWNAFNSKVLEAMYDYAPISMHCNKTSAVSFPVSLHGVEW